MVLGTDEVQTWRHKGWVYQRFFDEGNLVIWRRLLNHRWVHHGVEILQMWVNGAYVGHEKAYGPRGVILHEMYQDYCRQIQTD